MTNSSDLKSSASSALSSAGDALGNTASGLADKALGTAGGALGKAGSASGFSIGDFLPTGATPFTQNARLVKLQLCEGGQLNERLPAQKAEGEEALSAPYCYKVTCQSPESGIELKHLLGLPAQIGILTANAGGRDGGEEEIIRCGLITNVEALGADGGFARYCLTIEPPLALLRHKHTSRVFQDISVPDIVKTILDEHLATNPGFSKTFAHRFDLSGSYPPRSYTLQYRETELDFLHRLLAEEGIAYRFEHTGGQTDDTEDPQTPFVTFVAFDDPYSLPQASQGEIRFHRSDATEAEDTLTDWTSQRQIGPGTVSLQSFDYKPAASRGGAQGTRTAQGESGSPIETALEDFDPQTLYYAGPGEGLGYYAELRQQAHDRQKKSFAGAGTVRELRAGEWFQLTDHPDFEALTPEEAEFVVTRLTFSAANNLPRQGQGQGQGQNQQKSDTPAQPYTVKLETQRRGIALVPTFAHGQHAKPSAPGEQTAIVVGPANEEVYTDEMGRIKIQFHWQRLKEHQDFGARFDERSSCWVRVAYPSAGAAWGHQFIPRIGQEVAVAFLENDIDRPFVTGVVYNGRQPVPYFSGAGHLPANRALSGIKTKEHHGSQYNELLFDDTLKEVKVKLSSEHGKTQLNLGYLGHPRVDGKAEPRGEGFELRTDRAGSLRAAQGLLLSTEAKAGATGGQLDREQASGQLQVALDFSAKLSELAEHQESFPVETGEALDVEGATYTFASEAERREHYVLEHLVKATQTWEAGTNTDPEGKTQTETSPGRQAILLASGAQAVGIVTPRELALSAGSNLDIVSQRDTQQTTARRWIHNVGKKISLFVQGVSEKVNLRLVTAKGHAQIHAQSGDVEIAGDKNLRLYACKEKLVVIAEKELLLACGGAYIRLKDGNIDIHAPGRVSTKAINVPVDGPTSMRLPPLRFPEGDLCIECLLNALKANSPLAAI